MPTQEEQGEEVRVTTAVTSSYPLRLPLARADCHDRDTFRGQEMGTK